MKNLFVTLVTFSLALIIGCNENLINEPGTVLEKSNDLITRNVIQFSRDLRDPVTGLSVIQGTLTYTHQIINQFKYDEGKSKISITLELEAALYGKVNMINKQWGVKGKSYHEVSVSQEGIFPLTEKYTVKDRKDVILVVQYLVTTDGVGIADMRLVETGN
jgi:hypothetical protein